MNNEDAQTTLEAMGGIRYLGGLCPVQGEGYTRDGYPWYFRARGDGWSFAVSANQGGDEYKFPNGSIQDRFSRGEDWGDEPFEAGYMPEDTCRHFIFKCLREYQAERKEDESCVDSAYVGCDGHNAQHPSYSFFFQGITL